MARLFYYLRMRYHQARLAWLKARLRRLERKYDQTP